MRDHSSHVEVTREKARELFATEVTFKPATETIPVDQAFNRILAKNVTAQLDMPNCLTCKMDSVAVHWDHFKDGMPDTTGWQRGREWEFANTGIGMPLGYDTAIVIEHVTLADDYSWIKFDSAPSAQYAGTSQAGSRMHQGDVLAPAGSVLTPLLLSHIASGNNATVEVIKKPRVAFIPTGNELVPVGSDVPRGKNIETNSLLAVGKIDAWGGICKVWDIVPDDPEAIKKAIIAAAAESDIVVINAGSSKGSDDWNIEMLEEVGRVLYHETNHGPGHHSSGAVIDGTPVVGISGPPAGASFTMDFYLYPLIRQYFGLPCELEHVTARLSMDFPDVAGKNAGSKDKLASADKDAAAGKGASGDKSASGDKAASGDKSKVVPGEVRPSIVADGRVFYGVKQLRLVQDPQTAEFTLIPGSSGHMGPVEANAMDCYYMLDSKACPAVGDLIEVEVRP